MALAFDAASDGSFASGVTTLSWSHTCTGSDLVLFVGVAFQGAGENVTGITYNGVAMTELWDTNSGPVFSVGYLLGNPATGTHTVEVTFSGTVDPCAGGAVSFTGGDTASPGRTPVTAADGTATATVDASDAVSGDIVIDCAYCVSNTITAGANQTSRVQRDAIGGGSSSFGISTQAGADGGVMSWTLGGGANWWVTGAVAIKAGSGGGGGASSTYSFRNLRVRAA